jgi:hypothetical protein
MLFVQQTLPVEDNPHFAFVLLQSGRELFG